MGVSRNLFFSEGSSYELRFPLSRRSCCFLFCVLTIVVDSSFFPNVFALSRIGALTVVGANYVRTSVIDTTQGFAYFGMGEGVVVKVRLSDFTQVGTLTFHSGENLVSSGVIDPGGGFAYFGGSLWSNTSHVGIVEKVRLSDFTEVAALNLTANLCSGSCSTGSAAVIDTVRGFAYFVMNMDPSTIYKIRLSNFTLVGSFTLNPGENNIGGQSAAIDPANGYAYFGTGNIPGALVKIRLSNLTRVGALTLQSGENNIGAAVIDSNIGFIYLGLSTNPAIIVRIRLSDLTEQGTLNLSPEIEASSAAIDTVNGFAYFGMYYTNPGVVVQIRLSNFTWSGALTLNYGENYFQTAVADLSHGALYLGDDSSNLIVKVSIPSTTAGTTSVSLPNPFLLSITIALVALIASHRKRSITTKTT